MNDITTSNVNLPTADTPKVTACAPAPRCFTSADDFRTHHTDTDLDRLEEIIATAERKTEAFPNTEFDFSYSTAIKLLKEAGRRQDAPTVTQEPKPQLTISRSIGKEGKWIQRSFTLRADLIERLKAACDEYWMYTQKAILAQLLDEALAKYGF